MRTGAILMTGFAPVVAEMTWWLAARRLTNRSSTAG